MTVSSTKMFYFFKEHLLYYQNVLNAKTWMLRKHIFNLQFALTTLQTCFSYVSVIMAYAYLP